MLYKTPRELKEFKRIPHPLAATSPSLLSPRYRAVQAAAAVFCLGFGALNIFTALGFGDTSLPGLYSFRAATVGDGILLPMLAYALVRAADPRGPGSRFQVVFSTAGGAFGLLAGMTVQTLALIDPDTRLDWTFPAPHSYNIPGWYHAIFLIAASGLYARGMALVLAQMYEEARDSLALALRRVRSPGALGVLIPAFAFLGLLEEDNLAPDPGTRLIVLVSLLASGTVVGAALCWACGRAAARWCVLAVLAALLPVITLCDLFLPGHAASFPAALLAGATGLGIVAISHALTERSRGPAARTVLACLAACQAICAIGPVYAIATTTRPVTLAHFALGFLASVLLALCELLALRALLRVRQYQPYASS